MLLALSAISSLVDAMAKSKSASKTAKGGKVRPRREPARSRARQPKSAYDVQQQKGNGDGHNPSPLAEVVARSSAEFSIVGVGASAGGLETFTQFLQSLP